MMIQPAGVLAVCAIMWDPYELGWSFQSIKCLDFKNKTSFTSMVTNSSASP